MGQWLDPMQKDGNQRTSLDVAAAFGNKMFLDLFERKRGMSIRLSVEFIFAEFVIFKTCLLWVHISLDVDLGLCSYNHHLLDKVAQIDLQSLDRQ